MTESEMPGRISPLPESQAAEADAVGAARSLASEGRVEEAMELLCAALAANGDDPGKLRELGMLHQARGQHLEAIESFQRALWVNPADVQAFEPMVASLLVLGQLEVASSLAEAMRARFPDLPRVEVVAAVLAYRRRRDQLLAAVEATPAVRRELLACLAAQPQDADVVAKLARAMVEGMVGTGKERMLAVWDFRTQPYSVGDLVLFHQGIQIVAERAGFSKVDLAIIAETSQPARESFRRLGIDASNYLDHIQQLLPVLLMARRESSLLFFNSQALFAKFLADNGGQYALWPPRDVQESGVDLNELHMAQLAQHQAVFGELPKVEVRGSLMDWATRFLSEHSRGRVPVVVQVRNAGAYNPERNSNMDAWIAFFKRRRRIGDARFFVICARSEVDERLHRLDNVVVTKSHGTSVEQDLALVRSAAAFMGISSGPGAMAMVGAAPYAILNVRVSPATARCLSALEPGVFRLAFAGPDQRLVARGLESLESIDCEYERLSAAVVRRTHLEGPRERASNSPLRLR